MDSADPDRNRASDATGWSIERVRQISHGLEPRIEPLDLSQVCQGEVARGSWPAGVRPRRAGATTGRRVVPSDSGRGAIRRTRSAWARVALPARQLVRTAPASGIGRSFALPPIRPRP